MSVKLFLASSKAECHCDDQVSALRAEKKKRRKSQGLDSFHIGEKLKLSRRRSGQLQDDEETQADQRGDGSVGRPAAQIQSPPEEGGGDELRVKEDGGDNPVKMKNKETRLAERPSQKNRHMVSQRPITAEQGHPW